MTGAFVESNLTYDKSQITNAINSMVPAGGTPMRLGIYTAVKQIISDSSYSARSQQGAVDAIILLTDGKYNVGGDPQGIVTSPYSVTSYPGLPGPDILRNDGTGPGTGSVITWAKNNGIKIYTIALVGSDTTDQPDVAMLQSYADQTGGKAYVANTGYGPEQHLH